MNKDRKSGFIERISSYAREMLDPDRARNELSWMSDFEVPEKFPDNDSNNQLAQTSATRKPVEIIKEIIDDIRIVLSGIDEHY